MPPKREDRESATEDRLVAIEERRFVVLLGILAIFIAYRNDFPQSFPFLLPYPVPHLQVLVLPLFDRFVVAFGLYALCMFGYFSEDHVPDWLRTRLRRLGWAVLIGYWAYFLYISSGLLGSVFLSGALLIVYLLAVTLGLWLIGAAFAEYVIGGRGWIRWAVREFLSPLRKLHNRSNYVRKTSRDLRKLTPSQRWDLYIVLLLTFGVVVPAAIFLYLGYSASWSITAQNQIQVANIMVGFLTVDGLLLGLKTRLREALGPTEVPRANAIEALQIGVLTISLFWSLITMFYASFSTDLGLISNWFKASIVAFYVAVALYSGFAIVSRRYIQSSQS